MFYIDIDIICLFAWFLIRVFFFVWWCFFKLRYFFIWSRRFRIFVFFGCFWGRQVIVQRCFASGFNGDLCVWFRCFMALSCLIMFVSIDLKL